MEDRLDKLEDRLEEVRGEVLDSQKSLHSISSDIHVMSQTSVRMEQALSKLLETEVKFQLHAQKVEQGTHENSRLFKDLFTRLEILEVHDAEFSNILYQTCDIKSKEIEVKSKETLTAANTVANQNFRYSLYLMGVMFSLFLTYMGYVDNQNGELSNRIAIRESVSVQNGTNILSIQEDVTEIHNDIKDLRKDILEAIK